MRRIKAFLVMVLLFTVITASSAYAAGDDGGISPYYSYTISVSAGLSMSETGTASCYGEITVYDSTSEIDLNVRLQKKEGEVWVLVKKWSASSVGRNGLSISKDYQVEAGTYRVIASGIVTDANGDFETVSCIANPRTYTP